MSDDVNNLLPSFESNLWTTWEPYEILHPEFSKYERDNQYILAIHGKVGYNSYGKWICTVSNINGGKAYSFSVEYRTEDIRSELVSISVILTWLNSKEEMVARDYIDNIKYIREDWKCLFRTLESPSEACSVRVELAARWILNGKVEWMNPLLVETERFIHRKVIVATTFLQPMTKKENNIELTLAETKTTTDLNKFAQENGFVLSRIDVRKRSLESEYLELVK